MWLTWESSRNHVRKSSVLASGTGLHELTHVAKDRGSGDESIGDALGEHALAVVVPLDVADGCPAEQMRSEDSTARSCEKGKFIHADPSFLRLVRKNANPTARL